jgi:hypothetical protein
MPYSLYGIGDLNPQGFAHNMAMGRTGIALSSPRYLNNVNPASYHMIDSLSFFFDFGFQGDIVKYSTLAEGSQHATDLNIRNLAIGFSLTKNWKSSIGINPYSSVGYKIKTTKEIEGTPSGLYNAQITGTGGLNKFYWNNSYVLFNHVSLGVGFNYLFGNIESSERINAPGLTETDIIIKQSSYYHKLYADFGLQFWFSPKKNFDVTIGAVYGSSHQLNRTDRINVSEFESTVLRDETTSEGTFDFPMYMGGGIAVSYRNSLTITADYLYHDWSKTSSESSNFKYRNNNIIRAGLEVIPGNFSRLGYFGSIAYRLGFFHEESYLQFRDRTFSNNGVTAGLGLPFLQNRTTINLSYNYGINGTLNNDLIRQNYHMIMVSLTLHDWWFMKRKID